MSTKQLISIGLFTLLTLALFLAACTSLSFIEQDTRPLSIQEQVTISVLTSYFEYDITLPLENVSIFVYDSDGQLMVQGMTDSHGKALFTVPAGKYTIQILEGSHYAAHWPTQSYTVSASGNTTILFELDRFLHCIPKYHCPDGGSKINVWSNISNATRYIYQG